MSDQQQRDQALRILEDNLPKISKLYKQCYLSTGRGALLVYASDVIKRGVPNEHDYRTKEEILEVFDAPQSYSQLKEMIENYDQKREGIMTLITEYSNATFFVTFKLK
jgi:hypothetical protein